MEVLRWWHGHSQKALGASFKAPIKYSVTLSSVLCQRCDSFCLGQEKTPEWAYLVVSVAPLWLQPTVKLYSNVLELEGLELLKPKTVDPL